MTDLFSSLQIWESDQEESTVVPSVAEAAKETHTSLQKMQHLTHHAKDPALWARYIIQKEFVTVDCYVARIIRIEVPPRRTAFMFTEHTEVITSKPIRDIFEVPNFFISQTDTDNQRVVALDEVVNHRLHTDALSCILWSHMFGWNFPNNKSNLIIQYTETLTLKIPVPGLFKLLRAQFGDIFRAAPAELSSVTQITPLPETPSYEGLHATVESLCLRVQEIEDHVFSLSDAYDRSQQSQKALWTLGKREKDARLEQADDIKEKFGRLHEEVIRHAVSVAYGFQWGISVTISGLSDAISFVATGMAKTSAERDKGTKHLIKIFCRGVDSDFDSDLCGSAKESRFPERFEQVWFLDSFVRS